MARPQSAVEVFMLQTQICLLTFLIHNVIWTFALHTKFSALPTVQCQWQGIARAMYWIICDFSQMAINKKIFIEGEGRVMSANTEKMKG